MIEIIVKDTGVGIKKEDLSKLFKLFGFLDTISYLCGVLLKEYTTLFLWDYIKNHKKGLRQFLDFIRKVKL